MYLYFNRSGTLKEIINDEAIRQGNFRINRLYVYVEDRNITSIDATYLLPDTLIVGPENYDQVEDSYVPYNEKRDLLFFKYNQVYHFLVIDLDMDRNGNSPLDQAGVVSASLSAMLDDSTILQLGEVNFMVEESEVYQRKYIAPQEYLSLADYKFLRTLLEDNHSYIIDFDQFPQLGSQNAVTSNGIKMALNQLHLTINSEMQQLEQYLIMMIEAKQKTLVAGAGLYITNIDSTSQEIGANIADDTDINNIFN